MSTLRNFAGLVYRDAWEELKARIERADTAGDTYVAVPIDLAIACSQPRMECEATTVVNHDPFQKTLVEIKCKKILDPFTGQHTGLHVHGNTNWE